MLWKVSCMDSYAIVPIKERNKKNFGLFCNRLSVVIPLALSCPYLRMIPEKKLNLGTSFTTFSMDLLAKRGFQTQISAHFFGNRHLTLYPYLAFKTCKTKTTCQFFTSLVKKELSCRDMIKALLQLGFIHFLYVMNLPSCFDFFLTIPLILHIFVMHATLKILL